MAVGDMAEITRLGILELVVMMRTSSLSGYSDQDFAL